MNARSRETLILTGVYAIALCVFLTGISWGLPSRRADAFLFGSRAPWTGAQVLQLAGDRDPTSKVGADVDVDPFHPADGSIVLNDTDSKRAQIVRRYRLYSYQPDEMITFMSLSTIRQNHGDPKLYQYGGLWIYPVGLLIKAFAHPRADLAYYLDHPEAFARFYLVARLYVVAWGLVGVWAVYWIARKIGGDMLVGATAAMCYIQIPAVVTMVHEAKPHLPGAVLILLSLIAATKFVEIGALKWTLLVGALCGGAMGMILSAAPVLAIVPAMVLMRSDTWERRLALLIAGTATALAVYAATNPFVLIHLLGDRDVLYSNLQNSRQMYKVAPSWRGLLNASYLLSVGATPLLAMVGGSAAILYSTFRNRLGWMLAMVAIIVLIQFGCFATNKPGEYARFAILPDIALSLAAAIGVGASMKHPRPRAAALFVLSSVTGLWCVSYVWHFVRDATPRSSRMIVAERVHLLERGESQRIAVHAEPAPYSMPPIDLFHWEIVLENRSTAATVDLALWTVDVPGSNQPQNRRQFWIRPRLLPTPLSWAAKPWEAVIREP
jgi:hypothetical protein